MIQKLMSLSNLKTNFKPITRIEVENPKLVAQFYHEYLGFCITGKNQLNNQFMLQFNGQIFLIGQKQSEFSDDSSIILFKSKQIEVDYYRICNKVRLQSPLQNNTFSVIDCNGNILQFLKE